MLAARLPTLTLRWALLGCATFSALFGFICHGILLKNKVLIAAERRRFDHNFWQYRSSTAHQAVSVVPFCPSALSTIFYVSTVRMHSR
jgi:hypothetical protein